MPADSDVVIYDSYCLFLQKQDISSQKTIIIYGKLQMSSCRGSLRIIKVEVRLGLVLKQYEKHKECIYYILII